MRGTMTETVEQTINRIWGDRECFASHDEAMRAAGSIIMGRTR